MNKTLGALLLALCSANAWAVTGEETFQTVCATCHAQGLAGAPKVGDAKAWGKLIKEGQVNLTADGYMGVRAMPARGGRADLSVPDFANAVVYMANQSGGKWTSPNAAMLVQMEKEVVKREQVLKAKK